QCVIVRRDNREKTIVSLDELETKIPELLQAVHDGLYQKALAHREEMTYTVTDFDEMKETADNKPGFIRAMWCGDLACELKLKEEAGVTSRCMPFEQEAVADTCVCCGKPAHKLVYWGKAY
ncbi:MAG: proline--tRNA ligase, partial [Clostridia bacterium]|nr:proline--tRNA ligase [Clostridia bacterium]